MDGHEELDSLVAILDRVRASDFTLFVEPALIAFLGAVAPYSLLTAHGVRAIVPLTPEAAEAVQLGPTAGGALVYITRAEPQSLALVAKTAKRHSDSGILQTVVVTPELTRSTELLFTQFGILGDLELDSWPTALIPDTIDPSVLNLFDEESAKDPAHGVWPLAWALDALQAHTTGVFGKVTAVGPRARRVASILSQRRAEHAVKQQQQIPNTNEAAELGSQFADHRFGYASGTFVGTEIEHAVIIDRDLDLVTPLLSQTTYAGVLAETVKLTPGGATRAGPKASLRQDALFSSLSGQAFHIACDRIRDSVTELQNEYKAGSAVASRSNETGNMPSISEIRSVVKKLGSLQETQRLVDIHTELASLAMKDLERPVSRDAYDLQLKILDGDLRHSQIILLIQDLVFQMAPLATVLRLVCLFCLVNGGIKETLLHELLYNDILKTYGYEHLATIKRLQDRGLILSPPNMTTFETLVNLAGFGGSHDKSSLMAADNSHNGTTGASSTASAANSAAAAAAGTDAATVTTPSNAISSSGSDLTAGPDLVHKYSWGASNKSYGLYHQDTPEAMPYASSVPLTARIAQMALGILTPAKNPLQPEFAVLQMKPKDGEAARESKLRRTLLRNSPDGSHEAPTVLIVVVGGVTYAEATAIKLACAHGSTRNVVIAATSIITGDGLVT